jgi:hypothetical protein
VVPGLRGRRRPQTPGRAKGVPLNSPAVFCAVQADGRWRHLLTIEQVEADDGSPARVVAECPVHPHKPDPRLTGW